MPRGSRPADDPQPPPADAGGAGWVDVLDRLERDLAVAGELLRPGAFDPEVAEPAALPAWEPPRGLGPLPPELLERARSVAQRQASLERDLRESAGRARRLRDATQRINGGTSQSGAPPAYLNLRA